MKDWQNRYIIWFDSLKCTWLDFIWGGGLMLRLGGLEPPPKPMPGFVPDFFSKRSSDVFYDIVGDYNKKV